MTNQASLISCLRGFTEGQGEFQVSTFPNLSKMDLAQALVKGGFRIAHTWEGPITDVVSGTDETDHGKNTKEFPFHTDGVYYEVPPHYVILYCVDTGDMGGETFFTPTKGVIEAIRREFDPNFLECMNVVYMERNQQNYRHPLIEVVDGQEILRWSSALYLEPDVRIISEPNRKRSALLIPQLTQFINETMKVQVHYRHTWGCGDLLLFDNRTHVHGRTEVHVTVHLWVLALL